MINNNWKFYKGRSENAYLNNFDDSLWEEINIPHTGTILTGRTVQKTAEKTLRLPIISGVTVGTENG